MRGAGRRRRADGRAVRRDAGPGTSTSAAPGRRAATVHLRAGASRSCSGAPIPRERARRSSSALGLRRRRGRRRARRRRARTGARDVTREADLIEEVARIDGIEAPATLPARRDGGRPADARSARCAAAPRTRSPAPGCDEVAGWSFSRPALRPLRLPADDRGGAICARSTRCPRSSRCCARRCSARCSRPPRYNAARGAERRSRLFEARASTGPAGPGELARRARTLGALLDGPAAARRPGATPEPPAADFFAAKGVLAAVLRRAARRVGGSSRAVEPFLHPGRARARARRAASRVGWLGEVHPLVAARWDLSRAAAFELDLGGWPCRRRASEHLRGRDELPGGAPGPRGRRGRRGGRRRGR